MHWPNGLTIDRAESRLYWNDAKLGNIESSDFTGKDRKLIISNLPHPYGLIVVGNHVYWTDWQSKALHRADKNTGIIVVNIFCILELLITVLETLNLKHARLNICLNDAEFNFYLICLT